MSDSPAAILYDSTGTTEIGSGMGICRPGTGGVEIPAVTLAIDNAAHALYTVPISVVGAVYEVEVQPDPSDGSDRWARITLGTATINTKKQWSGTPRPIGPCSTGDVINYFGDSAMAASTVVEIQRVK